MEVEENRYYLSRVGKDEANDDIRTIAQPTDGADRGGEGMESGFLLDSFPRSTGTASFSTRRRAVAEALSASSYAGYEVSTFCVFFG